MSPGHRLAKSKAMQFRSAIIKRAAIKGGRIRPLVWRHPHFDRYQEDWRYDNISLFREQNPFNR